MMSETNLVTLHIWHIDPITKVRKYVGPAGSDSEWLMFKRQQGKRRDEFLCNNVGPTGLTAGPVRKVKPAPSGAAQQAMADARREAARRDAEGRKKRRAEVERREAEKRRNDEEMADIRQDAAGLVEQHKKDEEKDLEAGINR